MVCSACGRRVDSDRSFCRHCGSAVFIDAADFPGWRAERSVEARDDTVTARPQLSQSAMSTPAQRRPRVRTSTTSVPVKAAGCLGALVRLVIFGAIIWYVGKWLLAIPEVRTLLDAFASG